MLTRQDLLDMVQVQKTPNVHDPHIVKDLSSAVAPPILHRRKWDPNRYTVYVPYDKTVLSLGRRSGTWIPDDGITGKTDNHIHFFVKGVKNAEDNTILTMGWPASSVSVQEFHGSNIVGTQIHGYAMVTSGNAWHEAHKQHYLLSRTADIVVRTVGTGHTASLQSDTGYTEVVGGSASTIASKDSVAIVADPAVPIEDNHHGKTFKKEATNQVVASIIKGVETLADTVVSCQALWMTFKKASQSAKKEVAGWEPSATDQVKVAFDIAKLLSTLVRESDSWSGVSKKLGGPQPVDLGFAKVGVHSAGAASITGNFAASMYGGLSASMTSVLSASVLGLTSSVKGLMYTSIWGYKEVSVKGKKKLKLEAEDDDASLKAKTKVAIASTTDRIIVQAEKDIRLNSVTANAFVQGKKTAFIGAGSGSGWGLQASSEKSEVRLGEVTSDPAAFKPQTFKEKNEIHIKSGEMYAAIGSSKLTIDSSSATLKVSSNFEVKAGKVLLG